MLRQLPRTHDPRLLLGSHLSDDAGIYQISDDLALVQTTDFFTPIVDDPFIYGQIAAANSLSDVYAVGARPITALNLAAFPIRTVPAGVLVEILRGSASVAREAGVAIVGGHTIDDPIPKFGLAVTGTIHPSEIISSHGAQPGDVLLLTKPLGTGVIATALKAEQALLGHVAQAVRSMTTLNRDASLAMRAAGAHACTDITGFGLLGHLADLCDASRVRAVVYSHRVPLLPGALAYAQGGFVPGGGQANMDALEARVRFGQEVDTGLRTLLADPQTSGGLLIALAPNAVSAFINLLRRSATVQVIGQVLADGPLPRIKVE